jgi:hypothetical protein
MDIILFRNAKEVQDVNAKRMIAFNKDVCRNFAILVSYWLDKLGIPNSMAIYLIGSKNAHVFNLYYSIEEKCWITFDLVKPNRVLDGNRLLDSFVVEPISNCGNKSPKDLMTANYADFMRDRSNCFKYGIKLGDRFNLTQQLTEYYRG